MCARILRICFSVWAAFCAATASAQGLERQAAPFATSSLVVIAPTFTGSDGNTSYVRLVNAGNDSSAFTVTVVGSPSARTYGTTTFTVPAGASPQYALSQILSQAGAGALSGGDDSYSLYLQNADPYAGYQHVIYNGANGFFENVSACANILEPASGGLLTNVHTSQLASYPSQIRIYNYGTQAALYHVAVSDAATGTALGTVDLTAAANTSTTYQESLFELQLRWSPTPGQAHINLTFTPVGTSSFTATMVHYIFNAKFSAYVNMSEICAINPRTPITATTYDGVAAGSSVSLRQTGSMSVAVQGASANGTFGVGGGIPVRLTGSYDTPGGTLSLSGGGYAFTGNVTANGTSGTYTGAGGLTGGFSTLSSSQSAVTTYCGDYAAGSDAGVFNLEVSTNGALAGSARSAIHDPLPTNVPLTGQVSGASVSGTGTGIVAFSGTIAGTSLSGTYTGADGSVGTFKGAVLACEKSYSGGDPSGGTGSQGSNTLTVAVNSGSSAVVISGGTGAGAAQVTCSRTCSYAFSAGQALTLTASVASGDTFLGWSGACSGANPTCSITTTAALQNVTANFASGQTHTLTVVNAGTGSGTITAAAGGLTCTTGSTCTASYAGTVTLSARTATGTTFVGWSSPCSGTGTCTITMDSDKTVTATFSVATYTLTVNGSGAGTGPVTSVPAGISCAAGATCTAAFNAGTSVRLTAGGNDFLGWTGPCSGTNPCTIVMDANKSVGAPYGAGSGGSGGTGTGGTGGSSACSTTTCLSVSVSRSAGAGGAITSSPAGISCSGACTATSSSFSAGASVTLTATWPNGTVFQGWGGVCSGTGSTCTVTANGNQNVTATFAIQ